MILDISPLSSAIARTEEMLANCRHAAGASPSVQKQLQAGAIQGFEFTYELSFKMLRRYLQETEPSAENIREMSFPEIIRLGYKRGLLSAEI